MYKVGDLKDINEASQALTFMLQYCKNEDFLFEMYNVAIAQGFSVVAERAGLKRENLYKILDTNAKPYWETIIKILHAMDLDLQFVPLSKTKAKKINVNYRARSNSLALVYPQISMEWFSAKNSGLTPFDVTPSSRKKVWWRCANVEEHTWADLVISRVKSNKCPYCQAMAVIKKLNDEHILI